MIQAFTVPLFNILAVISLSVFRSGREREGERQLPADENGMTVLPERQPSVLRRIVLNIVKNPMIIGIVAGLVFLGLRAAEGAKMKADVESRLCFLEERVGRVETLSAGRVEAYTNRLYEKLKTILEDRSIDDARVLTEAAIFGDKTAVDEETVRLRSHIAQYRSILELDEPVGRKLDFLTQELNRETNTIGSKCQDLDITRIVVDMKAEIEKIREQIQNLE